MDKTFLSVRELAERLAVSEKTVYRMINAGTIPFAIKISGQWRFNSEKIEKWIAVSQQLGGTAVPINNRISLAEVLDNGLIIYRAHGDNRDELLDEILGMVGLNDQGQATSIKKQILYNESIISSSLQGVSLMAPEKDGSWEMSATTLVIAFLERPLDFKAIDRVDAEVVFVLLAANKTEQMIIKTKLIRLLMEKTFINMLKQHPTRRELISRLRAFEEKLLA
ncbi:MAG: helix-turn-helix domain-containing protein [Desulfuromonadales bacterium]|nr:helix-turn-helix domain-containing protein [Desulfuromonadales bacterium]MBN2793278.1 helix-turn-helix domain-containing protein [Desulfuromonadales bacterium]